MLKLKDYQQRSLDALQDYFYKCAHMRPKVAFMDQTDRLYREVPNLANVPYICLRIPTGGGKTVMACHALGIAVREYLQAERAVCLWLVPSNVIRDQTLEALKDLRHPYRQAVESRFNSAVTVLTLEEALYLQYGTLSSDIVIIVSTLAALRVEDTEGRRIYESSGALHHHFSILTPALEQVLEKNSHGVIPYSLANVLRLHCPVVIMDEAHNARTPLSFHVLERFNPSCIIEFTATPERTHQPQRNLYASNILHHVSAAELKLEEMIKLPIKLRTRSDFKEALADATQTQKDLEKIALEEERLTGEYLRPIVLLQAQPRSQHSDTLTVEKVKTSLIEDLKIPEERIAIATGETREIDDVDLSDRNCQIRYIITVQALKEGWDCPFAYILCSVSEISTARSVEQILGRVLRLPGARKKQNEALNYAHAIATSSSFVNTAQSLEQALIDNGFQALEAKDFIVPSEPENLFDPYDMFAHVEESLSEAPDLAKLDDRLRNRVSYDESTKILKIRGAISEQDKKALEECVRSAEDKKVIERVYNIAHERSWGKDSPSKRGEFFQVPALCIRVNGQLELFDESHFLEFQWDLANLKAFLTEDEFPSTFVSGRSGLVDVTMNGKIELRAVDELREHLSLLSMEAGWTDASLVTWLDQQIPHPDLTWEQATLFIHQAVTNLIEQRNLSVDTLARYKFRLRDAIAKKIDKYRRKQAEKSYQKVLFSEQRADIVVTPDVVLSMSENKYAPSWYYEGGYRFQKSYFSRIGELKSEGEEFQCACFIDTLTEVKYWIRNLAKREMSFWLPTSTDRFYPDFIALLNDGRVLVVEYKGKDLWSTDDSKEKRAIGKLWAERSNGKCIFIMPMGMDWDSIKAVLE